MAASATKGRITYMMLTREWLREPDAGCSVDSCGCSAHSYGCGREGERRCCGAEAIDLQQLPDLLGLGPVAETAVGWCRGDGGTTAMTCT
jgi:hypothetical protein